MAQIRTGWTPTMLLVAGKDGTTRKVKAFKRGVYPLDKGTSPRQARARTRVSGVQWDTNLGHKNRGG